MMTLIMMMRMEKLTEAQTVACCSSSELCIITFSLSVCVSVRMSLYLTLRLLEMQRL